MILKVSSNLDDSMILTKTQRLQSTSLQKASTDAHRADISKSPSSLLRALASKAAGAGCREVAHARNQQTGCFPEKMKRMENPDKGTLFLFPSAFFPYLCFFQSQLNF